MKKTGLSASVKSGGNESMHTVSAAVKKSAAKEVAKEEVAENSYDKKTRLVTTGDRVCKFWNTVIPPRSTFLVAPVDEWREMDIVLLHSREFNEYRLAIKLPIASCETDWCCRRGIDPDEAIIVDFGEGENHHRDIMVGLDDIVVGRIGRVELAMNVV